MRARRVRFTKPNKARATKSRSGVVTYLHNKAGWAAKTEKLWDQWVKQGRLCPRCNYEMDLADSRFANSEFKEGEVNEVVHKKCPKY